MLEKIKVDKDYFDEAYFETHEKSNYGSYEDYPFFKDLAYFLWKRYLPKNVLEVGCAKGFLIKWLRRLNVVARGVDISEYAISQAPKEIKDYVEARDFCDTEFRFINQELVVSFETIEHIPDEKLKRFVKNLYDATVPNGLCILSTPIVPNGHPSSDGGLDKSHVSLHSKDYWCDFFKKAGFEFIGWQDWNIPKMENFGVIEDFWKVENVMILKKNNEFLKKHKEVMDRL